MENRSGSMLPPDVRQAMDKTRGRGPGGIGGAAAENAESAKHRAYAIDPNAAETPAEAEAPSDDAPKEHTTCPNARCGCELKDEWNFCSKCGQDLIRGGAAKKLGIEWKEDDLHSYIFKGFIVRDLKVLGTHTVTVKSGQAQDTAEIDDYMMNGPWRKNDKGEPKLISDFYFKQMNSMCVTAASVQKLDGALIGKTLEERIKYLLERGSAFADLLSNKVWLFNQAVTDHVTKADTLQGP